MKKSSNNTRYLAREEATLGPLGGVTCTWSLGALHGEAKSGREETGWRAKIGWEANRLCRVFFGNKRVPKNFIFFLLSFLSKLIAFFFLHKGKRLYGTYLYFHLRIYHFLKYMCQNWIKHNTSGF